MIDRTPIYTAISKHAAKDNLRLHMPGHIGGRAMPPELQSLAQMDLTELPDLDDLHLPQGIIEESRRLMAESVGAEESFFLVNGASSGIHALLLTASEEGDHIILPRNAHRSFYGGMVLSGAVPVYMQSKIEPDLGVVLAASSNEAEACLSSNPDAAAVFITSPSYYGSCSDINAIAAAAARWGKDVMVDEAHGGHFPFHPDYPVPALRQGAAAVVNGLHKNWPVLNQGACLHVSQIFKKCERLRQVISMLTTTSPSYPLLASIETARLFMEKKAGIIWTGYESIREYKARINALKGLICYSDELINKAAGIRA